MSPPILALKPDKDRSLQRQHPWVFSGALAKCASRPDDGDIVRVCDAAGHCLGHGHYQSGGSIAVRLLAFGDEPIDASFWERRIGEAAVLRRALGLPDAAQTNAYRLINGEGDGLPGLIVDIYDRVAVVQAHSTGMRRNLPEIEAALRAVPGIPLDRIRAAVARQEDAGAAGAEAPAEPEAVTVRENGLLFRVDLARGQKTGFFLDQRENRRLVRGLARGRRVLNAFSYTGGFSVNALAGGAEHVTSVDASRLAVEQIEENLRINGLPASAHTGVVADAMDFLKRLPAAYDLIVLDPPAFAKRRAARHQAIQAYRRINEAALRQAAPRALVATFSCSQVVEPALFRGAVLAAAIAAGRRVRVLAQLHQPPDHPVNIHHPEGEYLKGFILQVE